MSCNCDNEIIRDGSSQLSRYLKALDPVNSPVDARSFEEMLVFVKRYADQIRFYDIPESHIDGDTIEKRKISWKEFFRRDMAVIAASIAVVDLVQINKDYTEIREKLDLNPTPELFGELFNPIIGIIERTNRWYQIAIPENPLYTDIKLAIDSNLKKQLIKLLAYEAGFKPGTDSVRGLGLNLDNELLDNWGITNEINADTSIYDGSNLGSQIRNAALYVDDIFLAFFNFISSLVENSKEYMVFALEQYPAHQPHMALFISFLELFRLAQEQMNGITERMLNFYYRDVLRLTEKSSLPDKVHIIFELAKDVTDYHLEKGITVSAGKDSSGNEQLYKINEDLVLNQAKVKELRTIFIEKETGNEIEENLKIKKIYARPVANSADGFGKPFTDPYPKWPTFGKGSFPENEPGNVCDTINVVHEAIERKDQLRIGFAIASPQLMLLGGKRMVTVSGLKPLISNLSMPYSFEIWLTGEKGWIIIDQTIQDEEYLKLTKHIEYGIINPDSKIESSYYVGGDDILIYLPLSEKAIIPYNTKDHQDFDFKTKHPVMIIKLKSNLEISQKSFQELESKDIRLSTRVGSINPTFSDDKNYYSGLKDEKDEKLFGYHFDGLNTLLLEDEFKVLPNDKPFDPFTSYPFKNKSFSIGSNEIFNKAVSELAINIKKVSGENEDLKKYLKEGRKSKPEYAVNVLQYHEATELMPDKEDPTVSGFSQWALTKNIMLVKTFDPEEKIDSVVNYTTERIPVEQVISLADSPAKNFLEIVNLREFKEDAKKSNYQKAQEMAPELQIKQLSVSYYSDLNWDSTIDQFFHVYPFGNVEVGINADPAPVVVEFSGKQLRKNGNGKVFNRNAVASLVNARGMLLPQFTYLNPNEKYKVLTEDSKESHSYEKDVVLKSGGTTKLYHSKKYKKEKVQMVMAVASGLGEKIAGSENQYSGKIQEEGLLFIGVENLKPLQTITLLFQFAEGSAEDEDNSPPAIHWSYLSDDELKPLKNENLVSDRTFGFQTTGIVKIDTPADASLVNQILPSNLIWFCASVTDHSNRIPQLINVIAQAAEFEFEDRGNDQSHFENALPAGSISKLTNPVAQVGKVEQPFNSFDGKRREIGKEFYTRVSERLRHKGRAINSWDYEHLILDRFPSIYKVKCISHSDPDCLCRETVTSKKACCGPQVSPGHVLIVPVANLKNRNANNRLQPKTSRRTLIDIADFLKSKTSPFVHIHTANPKYEQVLVYFKVKFYKDIDKGFFLKKLNDEIVQFLTPWAFDQSAEVKFGEKIYASAIINFIEERTYVDFITDFQMYVCYEECCPEKEDSKIRVKDEKSVVENGHVHNDITEGIKKGCNCEIPDYWMQNQDNFKGDVVAKPSTSRSILVSVPQHIIIPYEAPDYISPCEAHKIKSAALASSIYDKDGLNNEGGIEKTLNKKDLQPKTKKHHSKVEGNKTASGTGTKKNSK